MTAFDAGVTVGRADIIELDVQLASDDTVVVSHDPNTGRCFGLPGLDIQKTPYKGVLDILVSTGKLTSSYSSNAQALKQESARSSGKESNKDNGNTTTTTNAKKPSDAELEAFGMPTFYAAARRFVADERYKHAKLMVDVKISNTPGIVRRIVSVLEQVLTDVIADGTDTVNFQDDAKTFWQTHAVLGIWRLDVLEEALAGENHGIPLCFIGVSRKLARTFMDRAAPRPARESTKEQESSVATFPTDETAPLLLLQSDSNNSNAQGSHQINPLKAISLHVSALVSSAGAKLLRDAQARGVRVYVWTVNREADMKWAIAADLAGVITDFPDRFANVRDQVYENGGAGVVALKEPWEYVSWTEWNITNVLRYYIIQALFSVIIYVKTGII